MTTIDNSKKYQWNAGFHSKIDIDLVVAELDNIFSDNEKITPALVLDYARSKKSVLHSFFEWDDSVAAEAYRRNQAANLLRNIEVKVISDGKPNTIRVYETISRPEDHFAGESNYKRFNLLDGEDMQATISIMLKDLQRIHHRLAKFETLKKANDGIAKAIKVLSTTNFATGEVSTHLKTAV